MRCCVSCWVMCLSVQSAKLLHLWLCCIESDLMSHVNCILTCCLLAGLFRVCDFHLFFFEVASHCWGCVFCCVSWGHVCCFANVLMFAACLGSPFLQPVHLCFGGCISGASCNLTPCHFQKWLFLDFTQQWAVQLTVLSWVGLTRKESWKKSCFKTIDLQNFDLMAFKGRKFKEGKQKVWGMFWACCLCECPRERMTKLKEKKQKKQEHKSPLKREKNWNRVMLRLDKNGLHSIARSWLPGNNHFAPKCHLSKTNAENMP
mgnify:CR=1 FL=1